MEEVMQQAVNNRKKALVKALILVAFIVGAILLVRLTPVQEYLTPGALGRYLDMAGFWGPIFFILIYAVGIYLGVDRGHDRRQRGLHHRAYAGQRIRCIVDRR